MDERISQVDGRDPVPFIGQVSEAEAALLERMTEHIRRRGRLWLFVDYDGTLVPYAPTPDQAIPDSSLLDLMEKLGRAPNVRVVILSGRPLFSLEKMLPVPRIILAGLYGVEIRRPDAKTLRRADYEPVRKVVDHVKAEWSQIISGRAGFLLEDKGMAVALHSRLANREDAQTVAPLARSVAAQAASDRMRILGGEDFIEVAPASAHKGATVTWLLGQDYWPHALPVYFGDDDKDEEAFEAILEQDGIPIIVGGRQPNTRALARLRSPTVTREWLMAILRAAETAYLE